MVDKKFDPQKREILNNPERLNVLDPQKIWEFINIKSPHKIVDIGAGTAFITAALSNYAPGAHVEAFDIEPVMVDEMSNNLGKYSNITPHLMEENKLPLPDEFADLVWMINLYHELNKPYILLREIKRVLKPGGKLLIIDWSKKPESEEMGPPIEHRVDESVMTSHLIETDFSNIITTEEFTNHLGLLAQKSRDPNV